MKSFLIVDSSTNDIKSFLSWGNDNDLPQDYPLETDSYVITVDGEDIYNRYQTELLQNNKRFKILNADGATFEEIFEEYIPEPETPILTAEQEEIEMLKQENVEIKLAMAEMIELFSIGGNV